VCRLGSDKLLISSRILGKGNREIKLSLIEITYSCVYLNTTFVPHGREHSDYLNVLVVGINV
jgi:hypothetical protein